MDANKAVDANVDLFEPMVGLSVTQAVVGYLVPPWPRPRPSFALPSGLRTRT